MTRQELRKRFVAALQKEVPPEMVSIILSKAMQATTERKVLDLEDGQYKKKVEPNWGTILAAVAMYREATGVDMPKQFDDVGDKNYDDLSIEQLGEQERLIDAEILALERGGEERAAGKDQNKISHSKKTETRKSKKRPEVFV